MRTVLQVVIDHNKPLPAKVSLTDIAAQRIYGWLYSQGVEAGVQATLLLPVHKDAGQREDE